MSRPYDSKQYQSNRAIILEGNPNCHWCRRRKATTADHVIEIDRGGTHDLENLVPACHKCNSTRGAIYGQAARAAKTPKARPAVKKPADPFWTEEAPTPAHSSPVSPRKTPAKKKAPKAAAKPAGSLRVPPRLETGVLGDQSYGPLVAAWAKRVLGLELMDWQVHALTGQLAYGDEGRLHHRRSCVSVARQNGKSTALQALVGWWLAEAPLLRGGPQTVITTAHQLDLATALFQNLAPVLEAQYDAKAKWSYGRNELTMPDGSIWLVRAATPAAGHGRSPDLVVVDELWDVDGDVVEQGLIPAQRARRSPLCSMWSTAGTEASRYMQRVRDEGIALIDNREIGSLYYAEWSPAPGADLDDPESWIAANPAIGTTLELETLIAESKTPNRAAFYRASLNLWVASDRAWMDPAVWDRASEPGPLDEPPVVLAIDSSKDGERYVGVIARPLPGGDPGVPRVRLEVAINARTEAEMWRKVAEVIPTGPCQLAVTPGLDGRVPPDLARRRVVVGEQEIRKWTNLVAGLIADRRVCHDRSELLTEHMTRAVAVTSGSGITLSSYKSPGPIELARCAVWAAALATKPVRTGRPMIVTTPAR